MRLRKERALSQEQLADLSGFSKRTIENVEQGHPAFPRTLAAIAEAFGPTVQVRDLIVDDSKASDATPAAPVFGNAPGVPSLLIGREADLEKLYRRLIRAADGAGGPSTQVLTAVRGWPGVGKTTITRALAHHPKIKAAFPDGVLWASLGPAPSLLAEVITWGRVLQDQPIKMAASVPEASARLAALLRDKRTLLIVDDVWESRHVVPFAVGGGNCAMLVATRLIRVAEELAPTPDDIYRLDVLSEDESLELLQTLAPKVVAENPAGSRDLVRELEGLPLAIQVAGRMLRAEQVRGWTVSKLLDELKCDVAKLLAAKAPGDMSLIPGEITPTVSALLRRSTDCLEPDVRRRFAYLAPFAPRPALFELPDMMAVWRLDERTARGTADVLVDRGLLEPLGNGEFQIHRVLVEHARTLLNER